MSDINVILPNWAKVIRAARKKANLTQKDLAQLSGVAEITIRQYENGKRQPRTEQLLKIARALQLEYFDGYYLYYYNEGDSPEVCIDIPDNPLKNRLEAAFSQLNPTGQEKAVDRVEELTEIPKYQREPENSAKKEPPPAANRKRPTEE